MPPAGGGRRGRGRGGRGRGAGTRRKRAVDSDVIELGDEDVKLASHTKLRTEEIASVERTAPDVSEGIHCEALKEDGEKPASTRKLRRLRKHTVDKSATTTEEHVVDVAMEVKESETEDAGNLGPCGSLKDRRVLKDISNGVVENNDEVVKEIRQSFTRDGGQKLHTSRRSKRLHGKPTGNQDLDGRDTDDGIFENSCSSYDVEERKLVTKRRSKRLRVKYTSEYATGDATEDKDIWQSSDDDRGNLVPRRRSKRFGPKLITRTIPSDDEDDIEAVYYHRKVIPCRRMSKRLHDKRKADHISDESRVEVSSPMLSASSSSDNELLCNFVKARPRTSGPICSICKSATGSSHLIRCQNSNCSVRFHTFCQDSPLQDNSGTCECPLCKINQVSLARATEEHPIKKIQKIVGHRMLAIQELDFQYQFLVKWHSLSHHHDCWVPLEWLQVFDRLRVQSYLKKNTLLKEEYSEDHRKPEWFEVDRAIACRRKFGSDGTCDILYAFHDNKDFEEYEFLVKWKGLDYCEATWEACCTEGVQDAVSMLVERHQDTLKRIDCVSPICLEAVVPEDVHSGALYDYQLQGLQWIFDNFKSRRNIILADEMGLGKTVQVVCFLNHIIKGSLTTFPALVLAPKSILLQWEKEFGRWGSNLNVIVYQGDRL